MTSNFDHPHFISPSHLKVHVPSFLAPKSKLMTSSNPTIDRGFASRALLILGQRKAPWVEIHRAFEKPMVPYRHSGAHLRLLSLKIGMRGVVGHPKIPTHTNSDYLGYCQLKLSRNLNPDFGDHP